MSRLENELSPLYVNGEDVLGGLKYAFVFIFSSENDPKEFELGRISPCAKDSDMPLFEVEDLCCSVHHSF